MDRLLERGESKILLELLEVNPQCLRNLPLMRQAYKKACKKHHPDKGGDPEKMVQLNSLWQKYQQGMLEMRSTPEVGPGQMNFWDYTLGDMYPTSVLKEMMLKGPHCLVKREMHCSCLASRLINQHFQRKKQQHKLCLVWGECFCLFCFTLWFGMAQTWQTFEVWAAVIVDMPFSLLQLHSKYGFSVPFYLISNCS
ncbi:small T antigen [Miniopterus schreibersi polyomavirus 4]|nr:small T antigen [Miniopterus schreibersi polyomavirus 4]